MSDHHQQPDPMTVGLHPNHDSAEHSGAGDGWEATETGVAAVDEVLASVQALDGRPVAEHVAIFEQAHERLRRALDPRHG